MAGGGEGGREAVFKIVSVMAIWRGRGRRREEGGGGGMKWGERNTRTKETQASTGVQVTFFLTCIGLEPTRISMKGGFVIGSLRSVLMGVPVKAGRGHKGNKGGRKPGVRDVGTVRGG